MFSRSCGFTEEHTHEHKSHQQTCFTARRSDEVLLYSQYSVKRITKPIYIHTHNPVAWLIDIHYCTNRWWAVNSTQYFNSEKSHRKLVAHLHLCIWQTRLYSNLHCIHAKRLIYSHPENRTHDPTLQHQLGYRKRH